jgi:hypothetical protein
LESSATVSVGCCDTEFPVFYYIYTLKIQYQDQK